MINYSSHEQLKKHHKEGSPKASSKPLSVHEAALSQVAQSEQEAGLEPYFPTADEAVQLNQDIHEQYSQPTWNGVRDSNSLESAINRAQQHWHYGKYGQPDEFSPQHLVECAGKLGYGLGMNQPFVDGNKRTAFWLMRHFLNENGLSHVMDPEQDDPELADHLVGHGEGTHSEDDTIAMLSNRLNA